MSTTINCIKRQPSWSDVELYYYCDYETFSKLKALHKWYYQTLRDYARYDRWRSKQPQNRKGEEPTYCEFFKDKWGLVNSHGLVSLYQKARMPSETPVEPFTGSQIREINEAYAKAASYFV